VTVTVNGIRRALDAHPMKRLLDFLRDDCGLTGTKEGCGEGECGACTVLVNGLPVNSCLVPVAHAAGARVETIEGVSDPLQDAFVLCGGAQCGICTPGMIMAALPLPRGASLDEIRTALAGNLCRCTGYEAIFQSVRAGRRKKTGGPSTPRAVRPVSLRAGGNALVRKTGGKSRRTKGRRR
jgi:aerobic-type carbon monoxide dehydrogenase small subunit (CoxS/CutS family)